MIYLNRIEVIGNLTRDPELRFTNTSQSVASFSIATNRRYRDQSGNWVDAPAEYHEISVWGALGEKCQQLLHKGDRIFVSGRLQSRSWEAPDGTKRNKTEIVADSIIGPDQVNKGTNGMTDISTDDPEATGTAKIKKSTSAPEEEINIDDIPF